MPNFNVPDPKDPQFNDKIITLMLDIFGNIESDTKNFNPISDPVEGLQVGDMWHDTSTGKLKIMTKNGIKTIKFE